MEEPVRSRAMRLGFIGTGSLGGPVAHRLLTDGHTLFVHDARPSAAAELIARGATWCDTPAEVAATGVEAILLSLPGQAEVESVCFGPRGVLDAVRPGTSLIDLTTLSVSVVPRLVAAQATHGIRYVSAPVPQAAAAARDGCLPLFAGGDPADVEACRPLLAAIATRVVHTGDQASAVSAALVANLLWYVTTAASGEALVLGAKAGLGPDVLREVLAAGAGGAGAGPEPARDALTASGATRFTTRGCIKDLRLIHELGDHYQVPLELGAMAEQVFRRAGNLYGGDAPDVSVVRFLQEMTGVSLP